MAQVSFFISEGDGNVIGLKSQTTSQFVGASRILKHFSALASSARLEREISSEFYILRSGHVC